MRIALAKLAARRGWNVTYLFEPRRAWRAGQPLRMDRWGDDALRKRQRAEGADPKTPPDIEKP